MRRYDIVEAITGIVDALEHEGDKQRADIAKIQAVNLAVEALVALFSIADSLKTIAAVKSNSVPGISP